MDPIEIRETIPALEFHLDDRNDRIRAVIEDVSGVGPAISKAIAREYDSLADLRGTGWDRLESVPLPVLKVTFLIHSIYNT
ncbi:hypothetical protein SAMN05444422_102326 [Halobiforma haloterrestris]|uniref:Helix-hairpin-helix domain-containing protein n=1 Tax=Natronobacterium haloterrestre TaxID=148448 RepID=A0A1I1EAE4_NATHA|nr:helix-hairpin-helix domain-containing protein [Halobiforma haloterrestris]SFB84047.1 hypothetical protein SAMN05444422_102326 [Halobiforma haloterrestris]